MTADELERLEGYIDQRFIDTEKTQAALFKGLEARIDGVKVDAATRFPTRNEFNEIIEKMQGSIKAIEIGNAKIDGKADSSALNSLRFFSISGLVISFVSLAVVILRLFYSQ